MAIAPALAPDMPFEELATKVPVEMKKRFYAVGFVVDPRTSKWMGKWDVIMMVLLLFTAVITPAEVST